MKNRDKKLKTAQTELSIGEIAARTGLAITAIRFYEEENLIHPLRNAGGQRRFRRGDIRRLSFIRISQQLGFSLSEIRQVLSTLPNKRTPTKADWQRLSTLFVKDIDERIAGLNRLRENLSGCIGCGCLSMKNCALYNRDDAASELGAGPRFLLGDSSSDLELGRK